MLKCKMSVVVERLGRGEEKSGVVLCCDVLSGKRKVEISRAKRMGIRRVVFVYQPHYSPKLIDASELKLAIAMRLGLFLITAQLNK